MSKIVEALKKAEKERIALKDQQQRVPSSKPGAKTFAYVVLTTFILMIFGLFSFWAGSTGYFDNLTIVFKKNPRSIVTVDPPADVQSHGMASEAVSGIQVYEFSRATIQQLKVPSRSEQSAIPILQKLNNTQRAIDRKGDVVSDQLLDTANSTDVSHKSADRPPIPAKRDQNGPAHPAQNSLKTSDSLISPGLTPESKSFGQNSLAPVISAKPRVNEKEKAPDPGALIDWVLKKRSIQNE